MSVALTEPGRQVSLRGRLDVSTVTDIRRVLHDAVDAGSGDLLLDLAGIDMLDSAGLGVLLGTHRRAALAGRRLVLCDVPPRLSRLLVRTRLHRVLHVRRTALVLA